MLSICASICATGWVDTGIRIRHGTLLWYAVLGAPDRSSAWNWIWIHDQQCIIATLNLATRHIQCAPGDPGPPLVFIGYSSAGNELHVTLSDEEFAPLRDFVAPPLACT